MQVFEFLQAFWAFQIKKFKKSIFLSLKFVQAFKASLSFLKFFLTFTELLLIFHYVKLKIFLLNNFSKHQVWLSKIDCIVNFIVYSNQSSTLNLIFHSSGKLKLLIQLILFTRSYFNVVKFYVFQTRKF